MRGGFQLLELEYLATVLVYLLYFGGFYILSLQIYDPLIFGKFLEEKLDNLGGGNFEKAREEVAMLSHTTGACGQCQNATSPMHILACVSSEHDYQLTSTSKEHQDLTAY